MDSCKAEYKNAEEILKSQEDKIKELESLKKRLQTEINNFQEM